MRSVHHHVLLRGRGGATRVASMLMARQSWPEGTSLSFELDEAQDTDLPQGVRRIAPEELAQAAPPEALVHVHATRDWPALLLGFALQARPLALTLHDCSLMTGGCVYPAFCSKHAQACQDPCPRDYPESGRNRQAKRVLMERVATRLAAPSAWMAAMARREWPGVAVSVIPNGVDIPDSLPDKAASRSRLGIAPRARVALFLAHGGVGATYKGGGRFLEIAGRIAEAVPDLLAVAVGGPRAWRGQGVMELPYLDGEDLKAVLAAADVMVYPSLADNHPLVVLEAMAAGLPVAAYAVGGVPEQIASGVEGVLVAVQDEAGLAQAAATILSDHELARRLGAKARYRAAKSFSAERMAREYERYYARLAR